MKRPNFNQRGFTLVELVFVIAIIVVLASMFLPLAFSKLEKADLAKADVDIQELAAALTSFWEDLRHFPVCGTGNAEVTGADCTPSGSPNLTNASNDLTYLLAGSGSAGLTPPTDASSGSSWTTGATTSLASATDAVSNIFNHLVVNDPVDSVTTADTDYPTSKWKGPYISRLGPDPWGSPYVIHVGAMEKSGQPGKSGGKGWIISAGPNGTLDTAIDATSLSGDDRGFILNSAQ